MSEPQIHFRTCTICEAMCGVRIEHDGERVLDLRGDESDPFSRGHICPKAIAMKEIHEDPDRRRSPERRDGDAWKDVAWQDAFAECGQRIAEIQDRHGKNSVAIYTGNPTVHNHGTVLFQQVLVRMLGSRSCFSATSVDQLPHMLAGLKMFGSQVLMPVPDVDRTDWLLMLGANPVVSNGSIMTAPGIKRRLQMLKRRGGKLIVVDPRRTETAKLADQYVPIRPGTDGLLLAAMANHLFAEGLVNLGELAVPVDGLDELKAALMPFTPSRVCETCGVPASVIVGLADELARATRAAVYGRLGICTQKFGGVNAWLVLVLNVLTGRLDAPGGMMFTEPAADLIKMASLAGQTGHFAKGHTRVRGLPEFGGEYPVSALAEEIDTEGEGQIKALITIAGNPVLSAPNGTRLEKALSKLDFMVSIDLYRNETSRFADYLLPPTSMLETSHYDLAFSAFTVRNVAKYSLPLFAPPASGRADWEILCGLTEGMLQARSGPSAWAQRAQLAVLRSMGPDGMVNSMLRTGPYGMLRGGQNLSLPKLKENPHGLDLGPLRPMIKKRIRTKGGAVKVAPHEFVADLARLEQSITAPTDALRLIGRRQLRTNNSWLHNAPMMAKGRDRCTLMMHTDDAAARGLEHGERVVLRSGVGSIEVPLHVTTDIMAGVVSLPHGFGHARKGVVLNVARRLAPGASINDVTDSSEVDELSGTAALNGQVVEVVAVAP